MNERPVKFKDIIKIKPSMFDLSEKSSLSNYGFFVDSGWYSAIRDMVLELAELDLPADFKISQIKSGLRVYYYPLEFQSKPQVVEIIERYRLALESVCERCGKFTEPNRGIFSENAIRCDRCESAILMAFIAVSPK